MPYDRELLADAVAHHQQGHLEEAQRLYERVLSQQPDCPDALHLLGVVSMQRGDLRRAIELIEEAIQHRGTASSFHGNLAYAYQEAGRTADAIAAYRRAIALDHTSPSLYSNLGTAYQELGEWEEAENCYSKALELDPQSAEAHYNLGNLRRQQGRLDEAIACYEAAIRIRPHYSEAHANLANLLQDRGQLDEAIRSYLWSLEVCPHNVEAQYNLGRALKAQGRYDEALAAYDRAVAMRPDYAEAHNARGLLLLRLGDFQQGWAEYEWRWKKTDAPSLRQLPYPLWQGQPLEGKTLLVYSEQGIGDEIMFGTCLPELVQQAGHCVIECDPRLAPLFARSLPEASVHARLAWDNHAWLAECPPIDYQVPTGNVPRYLRSDIDAFPNRPSFLVADPVQRRFWAERLGALGRGLNVGICWRGGREDEQKKHRSTNLRDWATVLQTPGVNFISLQYGQCEEELAETTRELGVTIHRFSDLDADNDIDSLAALIAELDLVITVGNTTAHLAGALGKSAWTLLSHQPSWRWMEHRTDSPWYPSLDLIRQTQAGQWGPVFEKVRSRLAKGVAQTPNSDTRHQDGTPLADSGPQTEHLPGPPQLDDPAATAPASKAPHSPKRTPQQQSPPTLAQVSNSKAPAAVVDVPPAAEGRRDQRTVAEPTLRDRRLGLDGDTLEEAYQKAVEAHRQRDFVRAEGIYRELLRHRPRNFPTLHMMALLARETGRPEVAAEFARKAIAVEPGRPIIYVNLATALIDMEQYEEAQQHLQHALSLDPDCADAHINLGALYERLGQLEPAYEHCRRGIELAPRKACAHYNLANVQFHLGHVDDCIRSHQRVLELDPNYFKARWNQGLAYLLGGRFAEGWEGYEYRQQAEQVDIDDYPQPRWDGRPLAENQTLLIHAEQGVGDEIMFASCYPDAFERAARCVVLCEPRLAPLFARSFPQATVHGVRRIIGRPWMPPEKIDFEIPAGSLPRLFRPDWESFPRRTYLRPDPDLTRIWRDRLEQLGPGLKIGISWRAGGRASEQRRRSTLLEDWAPLLSVPGVEWVNLQYGDCDDDLAAARQRWGIEIHDWPDADPTADLDSFAAQVAALDFVISVGNTTVHMAGAVGVPAWSVLPKVPGWRWMVHHDRLPWYRDVWLHRQRETSDWGELFDRMAHLLRQRLEDGWLEQLAAERFAERFSALEVPSAASARGKVGGAAHTASSSTAAIEHAERSGTNTADAAASRRNDASQPSHEAVHERSSQPVGSTQTSQQTEDEAITQALTQGIRLHRAGQWEEASAIYHDVLARDPENPDATHLLGTLHYQQGDYDQAIAYIKASLERLPRPVAHYNLANALRDAGHADEAIEHYQQAVRLDPHLAEAHLNLGALLRALERYEEAKISLRRALLARPDMADAHTQLGLIHIAEQAPVKALKALERAAELQPNRARSHMHLGGVLRQLGRMSEALERFDKAVELDPNDAEIRVQRAMLLLQMGRFAEGWPEWEWRWRSQQSPRHRNFPQPLWDGGPLEGKRILVHGEQGIGDEIMFASCLPDVVAAAGQCVVECEPRLAELLGRSFPTASIHPRQSWDDLTWLRNYEPLDYQIPSGSLPGLLRRRLDDFPSHRGYLVADANLRSKWRERLAELPPGLKIGISWVARSSPEEPARTAPLANWRPLWEVPGASFISLQYGDVRDAVEMARRQWQAPLVTWDDFDPADDLDRLAALIAELDVVITVGNTTAHLAGALGAEVWTLVSAAPSWRWLVERRDSPWYPSMQVFQQPSVHAWQEVFKDLRSRLERRAARKHGERAIHANSRPPSVPAPHTHHWSRKPAQK